MQFGKKQNASSHDGEGWGQISSVPALSAAQVLRWATSRPLLSLLKIICLYIRLGLDGSVNKGCLETEDFPL